MVDVILDAWNLSFCWIPALVECFPHASNCWQNKLFSFKCKICLCLYKLVDALLFSLLCWIYRIHLKVTANSDTLYMSNFFFDVTVMHAPNVVSTGCSLGCNSHVCPKYRTCSGWNLNLSWKDGKT